MPNLSFYTQGDERVIYKSATAPHITQSQAYQWYAEHNSTTGHAFAARTLYDAITTLRGIGANSVEVIHLVGHGAGHYGDFVFIGSTQSGSFLASTPLTQYPFDRLQAPNGRDANQLFIDEIARVVVGNGARIEMQYCWSARGGVQRAIVAGLRARGCTHFRVSATRNYFEFRVQAVAHAGNFEIRRVIGANLPVVLP